jgi:hypothetical protein
MRAIGQGQGRLLVSLRGRQTAIGLVLAAAALLGGCAGTCRASQDKLAALRRGMSYEETAAIMGCDGKVVTPNAPETGEASTVEWDGPRSYVFTGTQIDFLGGKLLSYTTGQRGGL